MAKMIRVLVPLPQDLLDAIDERCGLIPRAAWLREAAKEKLAREVTASAHLHPASAVPAELDRDR